MFLDSKSILKHDSSLFWNNIKVADKYIQMPILFRFEMVFNMCSAHGIAMMLSTLMQIGNVGSPVLVCSLGLKLLTQIKYLFAEIQGCFTVYLFRNSCHFKANKKNSNHIRNRIMHNVDIYFLMEKDTGCPKIFMFC